MSLVDRSKREHCPKCDGIDMHNYVFVQPGEDPAVFVECASCSEFVARYVLRTYTCEDPYRSYLRLMRKRRMSSGAATRKASENFTTKLQEDFAKVKARIREREDAKSVEDLLDEME